VARKGPEEPPRPDGVCLPRSSTAAQPNCTSAPSSPASLVCLHACGGLGCCTACALSFPLSTPRPCAWSHLRVGAPPMGCFLSKEELMVASIRNSDTKKAQVALRMGVRLNGALNVRVAPFHPRPLVTVAVVAAQTAPRCVELHAALCSHYCAGNSAHWAPPSVAATHRRRRTRRSSSLSGKTSWTW
jgi:hypothetical protein